MSAGGPGAMRPGGGYDIGRLVSIAFKRLISDLGKPGTPKSHLQRLAEIIVGFGEDLTAGKGPAMFLEAGGLPVVIRQLKGKRKADPSVPPDSMTIAISTKAAELVNVLLQPNELTAVQLRNVNGATLPLLELSAMRRSYPAK
jgi:hypothetical protein